MNTHTIPFLKRHAKNVYTAECIVNYGNMKVDFSIKGNSAQEALDKMKKSLTEIEAVLTPGSMYLFHGKDESGKSRKAKEVRFTYFKQEEGLHFDGRNTTDYRMRKYLINHYFGEKIIIIDDIPTTIDLIKIIDFIEEFAQLYYWKRFSTKPVFIFILAFELSEPLMYLVSREVQTFNSSTFIFPELCITK